MAAEKRRFLDVWIIESNTVYREVPYTVVCDWIQQGRLLEGDQLKASGTSEWFSLGSAPAFAAYLPRAQPFSAEDQAEALQPVQAEFAWGQPRGADDEDVDMIPLIDVSLVLLIFFMMTTTVAGAGSLIHTPFAGQGTQLSSGYIWIGLERSPTGQISYSVGKGEGGAAEGDRQLNEPQAIQHMVALLPKGGQKVNVHVRADRTVPYRYIKRMTLVLDQYKADIRKVYAEVTTKDIP